MFFFVANRIGSEAFHKLSNSSQKLFQLVRDLCILMDSAIISETPSRQFL